MVRDDTFESAALTVFSMDVLQTARLSVCITLPFAMMRGLYISPSRGPSLLTENTVNSLTEIARLFTSITTP